MYNYHLIHAVALTAWVQMYQKSWNEHDQIAKLAVTAYNSS
jgi:hypothetical protein